MVETIGGAEVAPPFFCSQRESAASLGSDRTAKFFRFNCSQQERDRIRQPAPVGPIFRLGAKRICPMETCVRGSKLHRQRARVLETSRPQLGSSGRFIAVGRTHIVSIAAVTAVCASLSFEASVNRSSGCRCAVQSLNIVTLRPQAAKISQTISVSYRV